MSDTLAPWTLSGESLVGLVRAAPTVGELPGGLRRAPGPVLVAAVCYTGSPVGPYLELAIGEPARLGLRVGWCITTMVVDSPDSRLAGRMNWGYPKELGSLVWQRNGAARELHWPDRGIIVRGRGRGPVLPGLVPIRTLQRRADGPVVVPGRLRGRGRLTRVEVEVPAADPLGALAGKHLGVQVASMQCTIRPARHPVGFASTFRAPLQAPEPALASADRRPSVEVSPPG
jgi:hypothetical protein